jgi:hypothetical protein
MAQRAPGGGRLRQQRQRQASQERAGLGH